MFDQNFKKRQKGTGFTNIGKITQANVGAGQQMAGKIAQGIQTAGQNVQNKFGQAQQKFRTGFQDSVNPAMGTFNQTGGLIKRPDESEEDYAKRIAGSQQTTPAQTTAQPGSPMGNQAGTQTAAPSTPIDYSEIGKKLKETKYSGPSEIEGNQGLLGSAVGAGMLGGMSTSNIGQQQLLKQFIAGRQGYTKGQSSLDAMLMGQSGEGQRQLQQARQSVSSIPQEIMSSIESAKMQADKMKEGIEKEKSRILGGVQSSVEELEKRAQEKAQLYSQDAARLADLMKGNFQNIGYKKGDKGTEFSEAQAAKDKELLRNMDKFGLGENVDIEALTPEEYQNVIQDIATQATTGFTTKYGDAQKSALEKLARFQQDETRAQDIKNVKDKSAFQVGKEDLKNLKTIKEIETKKEADKTAMQDIGKIEEVLALKNQGGFSVSDIMSGKAAGAFDYFRKADEILGAGTVKRINDQVEDEDGGMFGASGKYKTNRKKDLIEAALRKKLQPMYEARDRLSQREKNKLSLKDYIKRFS